MFTGLFRCQIGTRDYATDGVLQHGRIYTFDSLRFEQKTTSYWCSIFLYVKSIIPISDKIMLRHVAGGLITENKTG